MLEELTENEIAARELRSAAYHEAGHKIIHARFGGSGHAVVWRNQSGHPDEKAWLGQYRYWACPEKLRDVAVPHGIMLPVLPPDWRILFGMAGLVAEQIMAGEIDTGLIADALDAQIYMGEVSATDLASMGIDDVENFELRDEAVEKTTQYLLEDWWLVEQEAECLIELASKG